MRSLSLYFGHSRLIPVRLFSLCVCLLRPLQAALIQDYICEACEKKTGRITTFVDNVSRRRQLQILVEISAPAACEPVMLTMFCMCVFYLCLISFLFHSFRS